MRLLTDRPSAFASVSSRSRRPAGMRMVRAWRSGTDAVPVFVEAKRPAASATGVARLDRGAGILLGVAAGLRNQGVEVGAEPEPERGDGLVANVVAVDDHAVAALQDALFVHGGGDVGGHPVELCQWVSPLCATSMIPHAVKRVQLWGLAWTAGVHR